MNILVINHYRRFKNWRWGRMYSLPYELVKCGHEVTLMVVADKRKFKTVGYKENGISIVESPDLFTGSLRSGWDLWCALKRILWLKKQKKKFDIIYCFETRPSTIYPVLFYKNFIKNIPLVIDWNDWWGRGGLITENRPFWYQMLFTRLETFFEENFRKYGQFHTTVSHALKDRLVSLNINSGNILIIPNCASGILLIDKKNAKKELNFNSESYVFCFTGFEVLGDLDLILEAFKIFHSNYSNAYLLLTGKVTEVTNQFLSKNPYLIKKILQLGYVSESKLKVVVAASDICLMPFRDKISNKGRFPGKVAEYLSMGKAIISNDVGEVGLIIKQYNVGIVTNETPQAFAEGMIFLINNEALLAKFEKNALLLTENYLNWSYQASILNNKIKNLVT